MYLGMVTGEKAAPIVVTSARTDHDPNCFAFIIRPGLGMQRIDRPELTHQPAIHTVKTNPAN